MAKTHSPLTRRRIGASGSNGSAGPDLPRERERPFPPNGSAAPRRLPLKACLPARQGGVMVEGAAPREQGLIAPAARFTPSRIESDRDSGHETQPERRERRRTVRQHSRPSAHRIGTPTLLAL